MGGLAFAVQRRMAAQAASGAAAATAAGPDAEQQACLVVDGEELCGTVLLERPSWALEGQVCIELAQDGRWVCS